MQEVFRGVEEHMKKAIEHLHHELKTLRTGRATPAMLEGVMVEYYGTPTPITQVANLSAADAHMLIVQPWDASMIGPVEKAIMQANLGLNPSNDGKVVRIPVPQLTEDRRKELVKKAHDIAEGSRNGVRQARREGNDQLKKMEKDKEISQDDEHRGFDEIQKLHDRFIGEIASVLASKEKDIMTV